jgi:hypothetical protein
MSIVQLTDDEREVVRQCLVALRDGEFLDADDIGARIGVEVEAYDALVAAWPSVDDTDDASDATLTINNALNEVCNGVYISDPQWAQWFTFTREMVRSTYRAWARARGWSATGVDISRRDVLHGGTRVTFPPPTTNQDPASPAPRAPAD